MVKIKKIAFLINILMLVFATGCRETVFVDNQNSAQSCEDWKIATLTFTPTINNCFSRNSGESTYEPQDSDMIAIRVLTSDDAKFDLFGYAYFNSSERNWNFNYKGSLPICESKRCQIVYIGNKPNLLENKEDILLDRTCPTFVCDDGLFSCKVNEEIEVYATLKPYCNRIKFKSDRKSNIEIRGLLGSDVFNIMTQNMGALKSNYYSVLTSDVNILSDNAYYSPDYYVEAYVYDNSSVYYQNLWIKDGNYVYVSKNKVRDYIYYGANVVVQLPSIASDNWNYDEYRNINVEDFTIGDRLGSWNYANKIISNTGIIIKLSYRIDKVNYDESNPYEEMNFIRYRAFNENDKKLGEYLYAIKKTDIEVGQEVEYKDVFYIPGASYYWIDFNDFPFNAQIKNYSIANF